MYIYIYIYRERDYWFVSGLIDAACGSDGARAEVGRTFCYRRGGTCRVVVEYDDRR